MIRRTLAAVVGIGALVGVLLLVTGATAGTARKATDFREQRVSIQADGYVIPGTFTTPRAGGASGRYPAVLLLHGTASQKDEVGNMYLRLAQKLAALGYASLRIDFAGSGDSTLPQTAFTYTEEVADTETALTWLSHNANVVASALGLVGFSQGGRVAATVAGTDPRVKAVATWSTWTEDGSTAYLLFGQNAYDEAVQNGQVLVDLGFRTWTYSLAFFESIKNSHPLQDIADYQGRCSESTAGTTTSGRRRRTSSTPPAPTTRPCTSSPAPTTSTTSSTTTRRRPRTCSTRPRPGSRQSSRRRRTTGTSRPAPAENGVEGQRSPSTPSPAVPPLRELLAEDGTTRTGGAGIVCGVTIPAPVRRHRAP